MKKTIVILMLACCLSVGCGGRDRGIEPGIMPEKNDTAAGNLGGERTQQENDTETGTDLAAGAGQDEDAETAGHSENGDEADAGQEDDWGLTLRAESVSATGCTVVFIQHGGAPTGELTSGTWYRIEKKEGDEWVEMPYAQGIGDEVGWNDVAWCIPGEGSVEFEEDWGFLYGELTSGTYRIVKEIMDFRGSGDYDKKWYYAEFSVMEESAPVRLEKPPLLTVISDETAHDALLGMYSWQRENGDGTSTGIEVDHAHPLDCEAWLPPLETTSQTAVLRFTEEPDQIVSIRCWSDENWSDPNAESEDITVMGNEIELKIGGYIYEVTAEWNNESGYGGTAHYSFYVKRSE
ncbi:MAG: hypothetical protein HDR21_05850 [Lachnospiraceae bacterium]|nr:hypothetical protein [Lachnospiraceae bacterium]